MHHAFVIKDEKDASYGNPVFGRSLPDILRSLSLTISDPKSTSMYARFPADFSLWRLGVWNEDSGVMEVLQNMEWITSLVSLIEKGKEPSNGSAQQKS